MITVAGITAWVSLNRLQGLTTGATALLQGEFMMASCGYALC